LQHGSLLLSFDPVEADGLILPVITSDYLIKLKNSVTTISEEMKYKLDITEICNALKKGFADVLGIEISEQCITESEVRLKNDLLKKYTDPLWNFNRSEVYSG